MSLDADAIVDRRRARRKLVFWRAAAFVLLAAAILAALEAGGVKIFKGEDRSHIARLRVDGIILNNRRLLDLIEDMGEKKNVKGVIVAIDSPGGTVTGSEALYLALRKLAEKKPTVAVIEGNAASGGYMAALAADRIIAQRSSITGSIGVIFQYPNVTELLGKLGVDVRTIKSAPLKAEPSPFTEEPPGAREMIAAVIDDSYQWFVDIVAERRKLDRSVALRLADGSVYTGRQALRLKLVDAVGGEDEAIAWLEQARGLEKDLPVDNWRPSDEGFFSSLGVKSLVFNILGFDLANLSEQPALDGLVALWHPQRLDLK